MSSKYREAWGDGVRTPLLVLLGLAVFLFVVVGLIGNDRKREAEFIGQDLSIEEIRRQMDDPDSYRYQF